MCNKLTYEQAKSLVKETCFLIYTKGIEGAICAYFVENGELKYYEGTKEEMEGLNLPKVGGVK